MSEGLFSSAFVSVSALLAADDDNEGEEGKDARARRGFFVPEDCLGCLDRPLHVTLPDIPNPVLNESWHGDAVVSLSLTPRRVSRSRRRLRFLFPLAALRAAAPAIGFCLGVLALVTGITVEPLWPKATARVPRLGLLESSRLVLCALFTAMGTG